MPGPSLFLVRAWQACTGTVVHDGGAGNRKRDARNVPVFGQSLACPHRDRDPRRGVDKPIIGCQDRPWLSVSGCQDRPWFSGGPWQACNGTVVHDEGWVNVLRAARTVPGFPGGPGSPATGPWSTTKDGSTDQRMPGPSRFGYPVQRDVSSPGLRTTTRVPGTLFFISATKRSAFGSRIGNVPKCIGMTVLAFSRAAAFAACR